VAPRPARVAAFPRTGLPLWQSVPFSLLPIVFAVATLVLALVVVWLVRQLQAARLETSALREELTLTVGELEKARSELKNLSGLLPMCAWCKKIRDDAGYWQQLEGYIQSHTHVEFSHSMCPECTEKVQADMPDAKWRI
jgi:hypothetical protein